MKKKIIVALVGVVVIAAAAGGYFWWENRLTPPNKWDMVKISKPADFAVTETAEQKIIENKSAGLTFAVPKDWIATSTPSMFKISSPEAREKNSIFMEKGCRIIVEIANIKTNIDMLAEEFKNGVWNKYIIKQSTAIINDKNASSFILNSETANLYHYGVMIPYNEKVYSIVLNTTPQDKDICSQNFQDVLDSVKIQ